MSDKRAEHLAEVRSRMTPGLTETVPQQEPVQTLKPCPICGNRAFLSITGTPGARSVFCLTDLCLRLPTRPSEAEAIEAWNRRALLTDEETVEDIATALGVPGREVRAALNAALGEKQQ